MRSKSYRNVNDLKLCLQRTNGTELPIWFSSVQICRFVRLFKQLGDKKTNKGADGETDRQTLSYNLCFARRGKNLQNV